MLRSKVINLLRLSNIQCGIARLSTAVETAKAEDFRPQSYGSDKPITRSALEFLPKDGRIRRAWVENMDSVQEKKLGLVDLHPEIFAVPPRIDIIWHNVRWQRMYKFVDWRHVVNRAEAPGGGRKPWPQKGMGRARHSSIRAPQWINGGVCHGPRSPTSYFYMLPLKSRLLGLRSMLSVKFAQDDLHVVDSINVPTSDPKFLEDLVEERLWGPSVLFIDVPDVLPENFALAMSKIKHFNAMPVYGLNVYSMLKHDTLVLTVAAVELIEKQLLFNMHRTDIRSLCGKYMLNQNN